MSVRYNICTHIQNLLFNNSQDYWSIVRVNLFPAQVWPERPHQHQQLHVLVHEQSRIFNHFLCCSGEYHGDRSFLKYKTYVLFCLQIKDFSTRDAHFSTRAQEWYVQSYILLHGQDDYRRTYTSRLTIQSCSPNYFNDLNRCRLLQLCLWSSRPSPIGWVI